MSSGRTASLSKVNSLCAPLVRMLPVCFTWNPSQDTFMDLVIALQKKLLGNLEHEHDEIFTGLGSLSAVFDFEPDKSFYNSDFVIKPVTTVDRIGYPLSVRISYDENEECCKI